MLGMWDRQARNRGMTEYRAYQNMAEDYVCKGMDQCHFFREFEGCSPQYNYKNI